MCCLPTTALPAPSESRELRSANSSSSIWSSFKPGLTYLYYVIIMIMSWLDHDRRTPNFKLQILRLDVLHSHHLHILGCLLFLLCHLLSLAASLLFPRFHCRCHHRLLQMISDNVTRFIGFEVHTAQKSKTN